MGKHFNVLHIFSGYGGGISSVILNLVENKSDKFTFDMLAFSFAGGETFCKRLNACGSTCYTMPRPRTTGIVNFFRFLDAFFSRHTYDAIHCHISGWMALPFSRYGRKHGIKHFFIHAHTTTYDSRIDRHFAVRYLDQIINNKIADCYFTCSDLASNYIFGQKFAMLKKTILIPNGINKSLFIDTMSEEKRKQYKVEFGISDNDLVIGHVGRFSPPKNHQEIINISKKLDNTNRRFVLLLVGDGERLDEIKNIVQQQNLNNIKILGRREDIPHLMQFFDIMILPSIYEGLPTVAIECQASGTHIFISDTITRQCDMHMGLVTFLPLNDTEKWVESICNYIVEKKSPIECVEHIDKYGFSASMAGLNYCRELEKILERVK